MDKALISSASKAAIAVPIGPLTRWYTDSFRDMKGEPPAVQSTCFDKKKFTYSAPRLAAMVGLPAALAVGTLLMTPSKEKEVTPVVQQRVEQRYIVHNP